MEINKKAREIGQDLADFIDKSPTPYHAVDSIADSLRIAGFKQLKEQNNIWSPVMGQGYFVIRNSSIVAWVQGANIAGSGVSLIVSHTDSPNIRLKPKSVFHGKGCSQFAVEPYGGLLLNSWLNRDLGIAGKIIYRNDKGEIRGKLVNLDLTCSIPQLAIHLDPKANDGLSLNKQNHLAPIITIDTNFDFEEVLYSHVDANCKILATDLQLYDLQKATLGGASKEFIYSARLDNLASCHAGLIALIERSYKSKSKYYSTAMIAMFDHEEVGNQSSSGADSSFLTDVLTRLLKFPGSNGVTTNELSMAMSKSFCISSDMAHALHPNYSDKHEAHHRPFMGGGPVIKSNVNQRYATNINSRAVLVNLCNESEIPCQDFVARSDMGCGSTVGPVTSSRLGVLTIDVGSPMLSMHSIREQACILDHYHLCQLFKRYFSVDKLGIILD